MTSNEVHIGQRVAFVGNDNRQGHVVSVHNDAIRIKWDNGPPGWMRQEEVVPVELEEFWDAYALLNQRKFGKLSDLHRHLTFILLGGRLTDFVYSIDTTNTEFMPYQFKPVLTFLESPTKGILIADEVGLGKTIEAGLIWTELRARYHSRRLVIVCPAVLRDKWALELDTKFGIEAKMLNAEELVKELKRDKRTISDGVAYVCSLQGLRPPRFWRESKISNGRNKLAHLLDELAESEPVIDLLIIDEAHYLRNPTTQNAELGNLLREVSEYIVLLSATPINNTSKDLQQLLHLLDPDSFYSESLSSQKNEQESVFTQILSANELLIAARDFTMDENFTANDIRTLLEFASSHELLKNSQQLKNLLSMSLDRFFQNSVKRVELASLIDRINLLRHTLSRTRKIEVQELKVVREVSSYFVNFDPNGSEEQFYNRVTEAVRHYAINKDISDGFLLATPQRQMSSCMYAAARSWKERAADFNDESDVQELLYEDQGEIEKPKELAGPLIQFVAAEALRNFDIDSLRRTDTKFKKFEFIISRYLSEHPNEKLIVFSYFKATLNYLHERLSDSKFTSLVLHGGLGQNKQFVIDEFRESEHISILLTSEIASEGVDLQFCSLLINYDLPWNPMKIEQRIGRIDRIGQTKDKVLVWNIGHSNTIDDKIYKFLLRKLEIFEHALGGLEPILGKEISKLTSDLLSHELTDEQEKARIEQTAEAIETNKRHLKDLEDQAKTLIALGDYVLQKVKSAHEFKHRITDQDLKVFVREHLERNVTGFQFSEDESDPLVVSLKLPVDFATEFNNYMKQERLFGKSELNGYKSVKCQFRNKIGQKNSNFEIINQFHPLIRFICAKFKNDSEKFFPLVACTLPRSRLDFLQSGIYAFAIKRWTFSGLRTEEVLRIRARILENDADFLDFQQSRNLVDATKSSGKEWQDVSNLSDSQIDRIKYTFSQCDMKLLADHESANEHWKNENSDKVNLQLNNVRRHRDRLLKKQNELLRKYEEEDKSHMISMTKGKIDAIEGKFNLQMESLKRRNKLTSMPSEDVCYGVILVTDT